MMKSLRAFFGMGVATSSVALAGTALDFTVESIDGDAVDLKTYQGQVVMIVNVASKCGYTKQYADLQELYKRYREQGFVILGFPANDFMGQEPGSNAEIKQFCSTTYGVDFPMFAKIHVKGKEIAPLYAFLTGKETNPAFGGAISWNFNKFLIGRDGAVINRFGTRTNPLDGEVTDAIAAALKAAPPEVKPPAPASETGKKEAPTPAPGTDPAAPQAKP